MKIKLIAAACAVLCSASAFAALDPINQAPQRTFFIAGASAQNAAMTAVAPDLFDTSVHAIVTIKQSGGNVDNQKGTTGWYGMSKAALTGGTSQRLYVVYNNAGGSNAGVAQVMSNGTPEPEANVVVLGAGCSVPAMISGVLTSNCTNTAPQQADMALSDVRPQEAVAGVLPTVDAITIGQMSVFKTALQGFGVIVNPNLYTALQAQNIAEGSLPGSCAASALPTCQPSIRRADYASLVTLEGGIKDAASLLRNPADLTPLTLSRRVDSSGTQAAANLFFANNVCGTLGYQGALSTVGVFDSNPGVFDILEHSSTGQVKTAVNNPANYQIGVVSLENVPSGADVYKFVKIDNVSPNYDGAGTFDALHRQSFASGNYPFAFEMTAMYRAGALSTAIVKTLANTVITGLKDSTKHNLKGIAYLDGSAFSFAAGKGSRVNRGGNNCQPFINN